MLKVSIVTVSFNQAEFLERTIISVIEQNYPNLEYIVVDPGSTDESRSIIDRYRSRLARVIYEQDRGAADGLNKGFAASTGEILGFLNSDDVLYPDAIANAVGFLESHHDMDVVSGHAKIIDPKDTVLRLVYSDRMSVKKYVYRSAVIIQPSTFFRRSAYLRAGGFNIQNRSSWDGELFLEMARKGSRFSVCDNIWSGYRLHRSSITASKKMEESAQAHRRANFRKVIGRDPKTYDRILGFAYRIWKHSVNPRDTYERIFRGPVYGRKV